MGKFTNEEMRLKEEFIIIDNKDIANGNIDLKKIIARSLHRFIFLEDIGWEEADNLRQDQILDRLNKDSNLYKKVLDRIYLLIDANSITEDTVGILGQIPSNVPVVLKGQLHGEFIKKNFKNLLNRSNVLYSNVLGMDEETLKQVIETNSMYDITSNICELPRDIVKKYPKLVKELQTKSAPQSVDTKNTKSPNVKVKRIDISKRRIDNEEKRIDISKKKNDNIEKRIHISKKKTDKEEKRIEKISTENLDSKIHILLGNDVLKKYGSDFPKILEFIVKNPASPNYYNFTEYKNYSIDQIIDSDLLDSITINLNFDQITDEDTMKFIKSIPEKVPILIFPQDKPKKPINENYKYALKMKNIFYTYIRYPKKQNIEIIKEVLKTGSLYISSIEKEYDSNNNRFFPSEIDVGFCSTSEIIELYKDTKKYISDDIAFNAFVEINSLKNITELHELLNLLESAKNNQGQKSLFGTLKFKIGDSIRAIDDEKVIEEMIKFDSILKNLGISYSFPTNFKDRDKALENGYQSFQEFVIHKKLEDFIVKNIPKNMSDIDKITYVTNFLANYLQYNNEETLYRPKSLLFPSSLVTASPAVLLSMGYSICQNYSQFAKSIFNRIGINCEYKHGANGKIRADGKKEPRSCFQRSLY